MGVSTSLKITFFSEEKALAKEINLDGRANGFIYELLNDGGLTFTPEKIGEFNDSEKEIMKVYFDKESMSVKEGYATVTQNIQAPKELKKIWTKIRSYIIKEFKNKMVNYHNNLTSDIISSQEIIKNVNEKIDKQSLFSKIKKVELPNITAQISGIDFDRLILDYTWSMDCISQIIVLLEMAENENMLVEITAIDN